MQPPPVASEFRLGLEVCLADPPQILKNTPFGLLLNQASVERTFRSAHTLLAARFPGQLRALFSPQHGLFSAQQDNMIESAHARAHGLPVFSLYSETRKPRPEMLHGLEALVVDLQDVGTRVYTYIWTLLLCLEACAAAGVRVVVLDRPNPLGGELVEGPRLDPAYASFVGLHPIPMRHGLTIGELAQLLNAERKLGAALSVVPMQGWRREMTWPALGRAWVPTSPNLPRWEGVQVYPGQVLLEGTQLSEGRGTTTPFEIFGAPWLDPDALLRALEAHDLPGVVFRPLRFEPTFHKFAGQSCGGLFVHATDHRRFAPYRTTLAVLAEVRKLWPQHFAWRQPPYEYETVKLPIDILAGTAAVRLAIERGVDAAEIEGLARGEVGFGRRHWLYE